MAPTIGDAATNKSGRSVIERPTMIPPALPPKIDSFSGEVYPSLMIYSAVAIASFHVLGLLSFSHVLSALLRKFHDATLMFLIGLMLGTLGKIWPWKQVVSWRENSSGQQVPLLEKNLSPFDFQTITGDSHQLVAAIACAFLGIGLVWSLEHFGHRQPQK